MVETKRPFERLPKNALPRNYDLQFTHIDLEKFTFDGNVRVNIEVRSSV